MENRPWQISASSSLHSTALRKSKHDGWIEEFSNGDIPYQQRTSISSSLGFKNLLLLLPQCWCTPSDGE